MPTINEKKRNWAPWIALVLAAVAAGSNLLFFVHPLGEQALPWLSLLLAALAAVYLILAFARAYSHRGVYGGKVSSIVLGVVVVALCGLTVLASVKSKGLPSPAQAPQVGEKAPDFTLPDTSSTAVSLSQMLAGRQEDGTYAAHPKAVLLVFYRGWW
jgi:hypothetical protein